MMGGIMDGIGQVLTYGLHLKDGAFLEASWDNAFYTRQWNAPPRVDVIVMPPTGDPPGGAGEFGVAASMAATACAYARATGKMPTEFPVNHATARLQAVPGRARRSRVPDRRAALPQRAQAALGGGPVPTHSFILNGKRVNVDCRGRRPPAVGPSRPARRDRPQVRLRHQRLQGVHVPHQRQGVQPLLRPGVQDRPRPTRSPPSRASPTPSGRRPAPDAGGLARRGRRPVRLLPARPDHDRGLHGQRDPAQGRPQDITDSDIDQIRNVCRCGTYPRIREAIKQGAARMS